MDILGITTEQYFDNIEQIEEENHILEWLTSSPIQSTGYWHQETGKCLGWEIASIHQRPDDFIKSFDIKIEEFRIWKE